MIWSTALRAAGATGLFAVTHSALASLRLKHVARRQLGGRTADALYRFSFNSIAGISLLVLLRSIWSLPDRPLYRIRGLPAFVMFGGQLVAVLAMLRTNRQIGLDQVTGIRHLREFVRGEPISPSPVVQHPLADGDCLEGWTGTYRISSHPNNYIALAIYWLSPVMTVKWASVGLVTAIYMVLGSLHEDRRLLDAYGDRYRCYRAQVPHLAIHSIDHWRAALRGRDDHA